MLPRNFLIPCLLLLVGERRAHGYELLARLRALGLVRPERNGRYADSAAVYRVLRRLEQDGLVRSVRERSAFGGQRRTYELTAAGREELRHHARALMEATDIVGLFVSRYERYSSLGSTTSPKRSPPRRRRPSSVTTRQPSRQASARYSAS